MLKQGGIQKAWDELWESGVSSLDILVQGGLVTQAIYAQVDACKYPDLHQVVFYIDSVCAFGVQVYFVLGTLYGQDLYLLESKTAPDLIQVLEARVHELAS